jgi:shikimate kinase
MNIILIGFMASGKSTIGKALAEKLGYDFVDTDELIELKAGKSISEIFANEGEQRFREYEAEVLERLGAVSEKVIATGGGLILQEKNRKILQESQPVFFLTVTPEQVLERTPNYQTRPLINYADINKRREIIEQLLKKRDNLYRSVTDYVVETKTGDNEVALMQIMEILERGSHG